LAERIVKAIESKKDNENWFKIYGLGEVGYSEEIIFNESKLKRFSDVPKGRDDVGTYSYTDIAYGGGDYFCSVFAKVVDSNVYVIDVIFNKFSADINEKLLTKKLQEYNCENYGIETNAGGSYFADKIEEVVGGNLLSIKAKSNKITRIVTEASDILDNFYFLQDIEYGSEYYYYFNNCIN
jgi:hypothetical protein